MRVLVCAVGCGIVFGAWQRDFAAGAFMFCIIATLDVMRMRGMGKP